MERMIKRDKGGRIRRTREMILKIFSGGSDEPSIFDVDQTTVDKAIKSLESGSVLIIRLPEYKNGTTLYFNTNRIDMLHVEGVAPGEGE